MGAGPGIAARRHSLQRRSLHLERSLHQCREPRRQRQRQLQPPEPRGRCRVARRGQPECVRQLGRRFRDTKLHRARVSVGARLPGIPGSSAYAEVTWSRPDWYGFSAALEAQYANKVYVNDRNTDYAPAYAVGNLRVGFQQRAGQWTFTEFARLNNFTGRN